MYIYYKYMYIYIYIFDWDSFHARLTNHYKVWSYKKNNLQLKMLVKF